MLTATEPRRTDHARTTRQLDWSRLMGGAALVVALAAVLTQLAGRFLGASLVVLTLLCLAGAALVRRRPRGAAVVLATACLLNILLHGWVVGMITAVPGAGLAVALSALDVVGSVMVVVAALAMLLRRRGTGRAPGVLAKVGAAVVALATVATFSLYATRTSVEPGPDEALLVHEGLQVSPSSLALDGEDGSATLVVRNDDPLYPRSFDVDALDVHVLIPPRTAHRVELPPGEHHFYDFVTMTDATSGTISVRP